MADTDTSIHPHAIDQAMLAEVVREALGRPTVEVVDWQAQLVYGGAGAVLGTRGITRWTGHARDGDEMLPWSVILKTLRGPSPGAPEAQTLGNPASQQYWKREILTYQSEIPASLPEGLATPRCFAIAEDAACIRIWMEDLGAAGDAPWSLGRFALAARHLGRFNGASLAGRPLPDHPWLLRALLRERADRNAPFWARMDEFRDHPHFQRGWPGDLAGRSRQLFDERHAWLDLLDRLPQTLQHGDADRRNLLSRSRHDTGTETVAIDWAHTGIGPIGQELAPLVASSVNLGKDVDPVDLPELDRQCFDAYLIGLREAGWDGPSDVARLGYAATVALRYGPLIGMIFVVIASDIQLAQLEQMLGRSAEEALDRYAQVLRFALDCADEARTLANAV